MLPIRNGLRIGSIGAHCGLDGPTALGNANAFPGAVGQRNVDTRPQDVLNLAYGFVD
jgi:hypothetical protein